MVEDPPPGDFGATYAEISDLLQRLGGDDADEYPRIARETGSSFALDGSSSGWGDDGFPPTPPTLNYGGSSSSSFNYKPTPLEMSPSPIMLNVDIDMPKYISHPPSAIDLVEVMTSLRISDIVTVAHLKAWVMKDLLASALQNLMQFDLVVSRPDSRPYRPGKHEPLYDHVELYRAGSTENTGCVPYRVRIELRSDRLQRNAEERKYTIFFGLEVCSSITNSCSLTTIAAVATFNFRH